jgi:type I restriction enzyme S subunit
MGSIKNNTISGLSVLVGCIGWDMGNVGMCNEVCATNQQINTITNFKKKYNPYYVYYWLSTKKEYLFSIASVTRTPILSKTTFEGIKIPMPLKEHQDRIVEVLLALDKKIELNNKINVELEIMAKTIYDYWFVQFDFPDENGNPYRSSGGEMVWNEKLKREIPKGWEVKELSNFLKIIRGVTYGKNEVSSIQKKGHTALLRANNIANGVINYDNLVYVKNNRISDEQMLSERSIFITMSSGSKAHLGKTAIVPFGICAAFGAFCSKLMITDNELAWLLIYFRTKYFKAYINAISLGTNINNINNTHITSIKLPVPPRNILEKYSKMVLPIIDKLGNGHCENQELAKLRDWLLPMLMNGQVTVGEGTPKAK